MNISDVSSAEELYSSCRIYPYTLQSLIDSFGLTQHVKSPTRVDNLLDLLMTTDSASTVIGVDFCESHGISDHRLVTCQLVRPAQTFSSRNLKDIDLVRFNEMIYNSELYSSPAQDTDGYCFQLDSVVNRVLSRLKRENN